MAATIRPRRPAALEQTGRPRCAGPGDGSGRRGAHV